MALFTVSGQVVRGKRLGTLLGFPTANLCYNPSGTGWPRNGVYAGWAFLDEDPVPRACMLNQGTHPTAPGGPPTIEVYLLEYSGGDLYGHFLRAEYHQFLRPEQAFPSLEALRGQLQQDLESTRRWASRDRIEQEAMVFHAT